MVKLPGKYPSYYVAENTHGLHWYAGARELSTTNQYRAGGLSLQEHKEQRTPKKSMPSRQVTYNRTQVTKDRACRAPSVVLSYVRRPQAERARPCQMSVSLGLT